MVTRPIWLRVVRDGTLDRWKPSAGIRVPALTLAFLAISIGVDSSESLVRWGLPLAGTNQEIEFPEHSDLVIRRIMSRSYSDRIEVTFHVYQQPSHDKVVEMVVSVVGQGGKVLGKKLRVVELDEGEMNRFSIDVPIDAEPNELRSSYLQVEVLRIYFSGEELGAFSEELDAFDIRVSPAANGVRYQVVDRRSGETVLRGRATSGDVAEQQARARLLMLIRKMDAQQ